jgi:hypothetical protein
MAWGLTRALVSPFDDEASTEFEVYSSDDSAQAICLRFHPEAPCNVVIWMTVESAETMRTALGDALLHMREVAMETGDDGGV